MIGLKVAVKRVLFCSMMMMNASKIENYLPCQG